MHSHGHHHAEGHSHGHAAGSSGVLGGAMVATLALVVAEFVAGTMGHSIALVSDGVHNLTDLPTILISWIAVRLSERPPTEEKTYGYHRSGILAAFVNAILLILVAVYILFESYERLRRPVEVRTTLMLWVAGFALCVNGGITLGLVSGRKDLNLRSILIHNFGDALSNVAIFAGGLAIRWTGVRWVDPAIGMAIGLMVLWSALGVLRESSHILLEGLPRNLKLDSVAQTILGVDNVKEVHDIHVWTIGTDLQAISCHVRIPDMHMEESERILMAIRERLAEHFHITHTTIQFERAGLPHEAGYFMPAPLRPLDK
ncbi:MAG TPA: cation diffusion facilitator family transporter [Candidatus Acidoferrales bacterium]|nr:cation diffusion facilitator family transporter [Candidatus Acidoferrales bacterium]